MGEYAMTEWLNGAWLGGGGGLHTFACVLLRNFSMNKIGVVSLFYCLFNTNPYNNL